MYVCVCQAVTDHEIRDEVRAGAHTMKDLQQRLGVAQNCGQCAPCAHEILAETLQDIQRESVLASVAPAFAIANTT